VVISVVSLLTTILVPSLSSAKDQAKKISCLANQRVLGMAFYYYAEDNSRRLPAVTSYWEKVVQYLDKTSLPPSVMDSNRRTMPQALFCPCDADPFPRPYMDFLAVIETTSYCLNGADSTLGMGGGRQVRMGLFGGDGRIDDPQFSGRCMMFVGTTSFDKIGDLDHPATGAAFEQAGASGGDIAAARARWHHRVTTGFFHGGKTNAYFADGHGQSVKGQKVDPLDVSDWPYGYSLDPKTAFYPDLTLPTASEDPMFWGPPYDTWDD